MRPRIRKAVRAMRQAVREQRWADASAIGVAAYRVANGKERRLLETYLGPSAAKLVGRKH
ncbi:hypothetical protein AB5J72_22415 [Streptomyces sp. CG1]|uniref:hypothetical protein n=1 Tax=unclassified Streptomyces TaxID=2593676 RepID=UPI0034E27917